MEIGETIETNRDVGRRVRGSRRPRETNRG